MVNTSSERSSSSPMAEKNVDNSWPEILPSLSLSKCRKTFCNSAKRLRPLDDEEEWQGEEASELEQSMGIKPSLKLLLRESFFELEYCFGFFRATFAMLVFELSSILVTLGFFEWGEGVSSV